MKTIKILITSLSLLMLSFSYGQNIIWEQLDGAEPTGNNIKKTYALNAWERGTASSKQKLCNNSNGYIEMEPFNGTGSGVNGGYTIGFSLMNSGSSFSDIDFSIFIQGGIIRVYEFGIQKASGPIPSNTLGTVKIERNSSIITYTYSYITAGIPSTFTYTSTKTVDQTLVADVMILNQNDEIRNATCNFSDVNCIVNQFDADWHSETNPGNAPTTITESIYTNGNVKVNNGSVMFSGSTGTVPSIPNGNNMVWMPEKYALRAGKITAGQWQPILVGYGSIAGGLNNTASGFGAFATGIDNIAKDPGTMAVGNSNYAAAQNAIALGGNNRAEGNSSLSMGRNNQAIGIASVDLGENNITRGDYSLALGRQNDVDGRSSQAFGSYNRADSDQATTIGNYNESTGNNSLTMGNNIKATGNGSYTIGEGIINSFNTLENNIDNSLMIGFNSAYPTLFVGESVFTRGERQWGKVGIGTSQPEAFLDVKFPYNCGNYNAGNYNALFDASGGAWDNVVSRNGFYPPGSGFTGTGCGIGGWSSAYMVEIENKVNGAVSRTANIHANGYANFAGTWVWSDKTFKSNIETIKSPLETINELSGKTYEFKITEGSEEIPSYGFIAQEVAEIVPELAKKMPSGKYAVNYDGFIPIITEAIKEQQSQIESKDEEINDLKDRLTELEETINAIKQDLNTICNDGCDGLSHTNSLNQSSSSTTKNGAWIAQNFPNPNTGISSVRYFIPKEANNAELRITNLSGKVLKVMVLDKVSNEIELDLSNLLNGEYLYTLIVDSKVIDSKKAVVNK